MRTHIWKNLRFFFNKVKTVHTHREPLIVGEKTNLVFFYDKNLGGALYVIFKNHVHS